MEITVKKIKVGKSKNLSELLLWAKYFEDYPTLDYMTLKQVEGIWILEVVLT